MAAELQPIKPMKTRIINLFTRLGVALREAWACRGVASTRSLVLPALIAVLNLMPAGRVTAQTFTTLHSFNGSSDGASPYARLILSGNTLYGTASGGGSSDAGTVFAINTDGTSFTNLHSFSANYYDPPGQYYTNSGGLGPTAGLVLSGDTLYGTASGGGYGMPGDDGGSGTVFAVKTDGTAFTTLHIFALLSYSWLNSDGANPGAGLMLSDNTLYGTAYGGGSSGDGTVFAVNTNGTGFTNLHIFSFYSDGAHPAAGFILSGNTLYGTTRLGGDSGNGTVFAVNTNGTGFTILHSFEYNSDGGYPGAGLVLSGNTLYGTALQGGSANWGTVFAVNTDGTGFTNLHSFTPLSVPYPGTNSDGARPTAGLIFSGNTLYGTAHYGGSSGYGTVFAVNTNGTGFTILHSFSGYPSDGANPYAGLILSRNTLYGTAFGGGSNSAGTVFSLSFQPQLTIMPSGPNVILSWPTNVAGFDYTGYVLQSTTNLVSPAVWSTNSPAPLVADGQNTVTNPISGTQQFYRLTAR
jgi:uncharacterized repeat protein (TIGR03803 family)